MKGFLKAYWSMAIVTIILLSLYGSLLDNHSDYFDEIDRNLSSKRTVC